MTAVPHTWPGGTISRTISLPFELDLTSFIFPSRITYSHSAGSPSQNRYSPPGTRGSTNESEILRASAPEREVKKGILRTKSILRGGGAAVIIDNLDTETDFDLSIGSLIRLCIIDCVKWACWGKQTGISRFG